MKDGFCLRNLHKVTKSQSHNFKMDSNQIVHKSRDKLSVAEVRWVCAAYSYMYDDQLTQRGLDPKQLRECKEFIGDISRVEHHRFGHSKNLKVELQRLLDDDKIDVVYDVEDVHFTPDGWTDDGNDEIVYRGLQVGESKIIKHEYYVRVEFCTGANTYNVKRWDKNGPPTEISVYDVFVQGGITTIRIIADKWDWMKVLRALK